MLSMLIFVGAVSCDKPRPAREPATAPTTLTAVEGSDGRHYVRVSEDHPLADGTVIRETWQRMDEVGSDLTSYYKIAQSRGDTNTPTFVVATKGTRP